MPLDAVASEAVPTPDPVVRWARPTPVIGDPSSARQRSGEPGGWALPEADRDALHRVISSRRDIRRFRPDPIPDDVLQRLLGAAHSAPSVGHSQPWRFVVVHDPAVREQAALLADRERHAQAALMDPESARRLLDLQLEGIREAPVGIVVCCDRRTAPAGVLGRATFGDSDMWSCACAIQNLWLAARADGVGVGWVTLFQPKELADLVGLPEGVETLGWLCLGWPDERPPAPGLERVGWSRRAALAEVVIDERWPGADRAPATPVSHLRAPDQRAVVGVRDAADALLTPPGSLGVLDRAVDRLLALGHPRSHTGSLLLIGADHPVAAYGISAYEQSVTTEVMTAAIAGQASGVVAASTAGLLWFVVDAGCGTGAIASAIAARPHDPQGDLVTTDALTRSDVEWLLGRGREIGRDAAVNGVVALGEVGVGNTTIAACLAGALLGLDAHQVVGVGAGADSAMVVRKSVVVDGALSRARVANPDLAHDPLGMLTAVGGPEFAVLTGAVLGAAEAGAAVMLDGLATCVAASLAVSIEPATAAHLIAGQRSRELASALVLAHLGLEPLLDLRIRAGEGVGACLATRLLHDALQIRRLTARTE